VTGQAESSIVAPRVVIGVDPGTRVTGYAVLSASASGWILLDAGAKVVGRSGEAHAARLLAIYTLILGLISTHQATELAVESPYTGANAQSALKLGRAQGVVMAAAMSRGLVIEEYAPSLVKRSVSGSGSASKEKVAGMLALQLDLSSFAGGLPLDATDAIAVALCHLLRTRQSTIAGEEATRTSLGNRKSSPASAWAAFAHQHPGRVGE
jgi:crossover junction endodeoxyribonuclease RuvC